MKSYIRQMILLAAGASLTLACAGTEPKQNTAADLPPAGADQEYNPNWPEVADAEERYLRLDLDSPTVCDVEDPHFKYDKSNVLAQHAEHLEALVACLQEPDKRDAKVVLVGHTDKHGSNAYNDQLAADRANAVKDTLVQLGIDESRILVRSMGESQAMADDKPIVEDGYDRRVDVVLLQVVKPM